MIKKGLLLSEKIKILCIVVFAMFLNQSCSQTKQYNISDLKSLNATHSIKNQKLTVVYDTLISNKDYYNKTDDIIVTFIDKENEDIYKIEVTMTDFEIFKRNKPNYGVLKGYMFLDNMPILLFGDINKDLFNVLEKPKKGVMNFDKSKEKSAPLIYEPQYFNFLLEKDSLKSKGISY